MQLVAGSKDQSWNRSVLLRVLSNIAPPVPSRPLRYATVIGRAIVTAALAFAAVEVVGRFVDDKVLPNTYQATAQMSVRTEMMGGIPPPPGVNPSADEKEIFLKSSAFLQPIVQDLGLDKVQEINDSGTVEQVSPDVALSRLQEKIHFDWPRREFGDQPNILRISVVSTNPQEASDIANAMVDRYKKIDDEQFRQRNTRGMEALRNQIETQQKIVDDKKSALATLVSQVNDNPPRNADKALVKQWSAKEREFAAARQNFDMRQGLAEHLLNASDDDVLDEWHAPQVDQFRYALTMLKKSGASEDDKQVQELRKQEVGLVKSFRSAAQKDLEGAKKSLDNLEQQVEAMETKLGPSFAPVFAAQQDLAKEQNMLDTLKLRFEQDTLDFQFAPSRVKILAHARVPTLPNNHMMHMMTNVLALAAAVIAAAFVEMIMLFVRAGERN